MSFGVNHVSLNPEGWKEYLEINRGIALMRAGEIEQGRQVLDKLGKQSAGTEELRALRDRANLGLGYDVAADEDSISAAFAGVSGSSFSTVGVDSSAFLVDGGLGLTYGAAGAVQYSVNYDFEVREDFTDHAPSAKVSIPF